MRTLNYLSLAVIAPVLLFAQSSDSMTVKTIPLRHLTNADAFSLLSPYVTGRGSVSPAGVSIHAVTVRASAKTIADVEKVLAQYDRSPLTLTLNFQLVSADYTNQRDPAVAGLDSVLRSVLKFSGYHVLTTAVVNVSDHSSAEQRLHGDADDYFLTCSVRDITGEGADATVELHVELKRTIPGLVSDPRSPMNPVVLSTGVTIPIGHTVVLGTSAEASHAQMPAGFSPPRGAAPDRPSPAQYTAGSDRALILIVRPQVAATRKD